MRSRFPAPFAVLLELDFACDELPIFARPIVGPLAHGALEFYELVLRHMWAALYRKGLKKAIFDPSLQAKIGADVIPNDIVLKKRANQRIHHKPCRHNDNEANRDIGKKLLRLCLLPYCLVGNIEPAGVSKKNRGKKYGEKNASINDILRQRHEVFAFTINPITRNDLFGEPPGLLGKHRIWKKRRCGWNECNRPPECHASSVAFAVSPPPPLGEKAGLCYYRFVQSSE